VGEALGLAVWGTDQAGPYTTTPYPGTSWQLALHPKRYPHEYPRNGTAKMLTLFHPASGRVRVKGVTNTTNVVLHGWLKQELTDILDHLAESSPVLDAAAQRAAWERWWGHPLSERFAAELPPLRMLLILDNLAGHKTPEFVVWLFQHGIVPLYTPLGGSWLNMTESIQRILKRRALDGQYPTTPQDIMTWLEATARGWNADPTPFVWAGKRQQRRHRAYLRRHPVGGSAAVTRRPIRFRFIPSGLERLHP
jgi:transposase